MVDKTAAASGDTVTYNAADLDAYIATRVSEALAVKDAEHAAAVEALRKLVPDHSIPQNGGGPGIAIRTSWSLAEQEAAGRGEDHWS